MSYKIKLVESAKDCSNILCMGLDPVLDTLPKRFEGNLLGFYEELFNLMKGEGLRPNAFKMNHGFYEINNNPNINSEIAKQSTNDGDRVLAATFEMVNHFFPESIKILDFKRGDIGKSSANYAVVGFDMWKADAVTVHAYMGTDSVEPFARYADKGVYALCRTSNSGAKDFQDKLILRYEIGSEEMMNIIEHVSSNIGDESMGYSSIVDKVFNRLTHPLYESVAEKIIEWDSKFGNLGAVVGATSVPELEKLAGKFSKSYVSMLIPGVGSQGQSTKAVMDVLSKTGFMKELALVNVSSDITQPWAKDKKPAPDDYADVCLGKVKSYIEGLKIK